MTKRVHRRCHASCEFTPQTSHLKCSITIDCASRRMGGLLILTNTHTHTRTSMLHWSVAFREGMKETLVSWRDAKKLTSLARDITPDTYYCSKVLSKNVHTSVLYVTLNPEGARRGEGLRMYLSFFTRAHSPLVPVCKLPEVADASEDVLFCSFEQTKHRVLDKLLFFCGEWTCRGQGASKHLYVISHNF